MDIEKFEKAMNAYTFGQHNDIKTYLDTLKMLGYVIDDLYIYLKTKRETEAETITGNKLYKQCPECAAIMLLLPVNDKPQTQTGDDSKNVWICRHPACLHTIYIKETIEQIEEQLKRGN